MERHSGGTNAQASGAFDEAEGPAPVVVDASARWHARAVPVEVTGPEPDAVQAWFADKVAFPVLPPEFGSRAHLIGGRLSNVERSEAAFLVYDVEGTKLSVMVFDAGDTPMPRSAALREGGLSARRERSHGRCRGRGPSVKHVAPVRGCDVGSRRRVHALSRGDAAAERVEQTLEGCVPRALVQPRHIVATRTPRFGAGRGPFL